MIVEKSTVPVTTADRIQKVFEACGVNERLEVCVRVRERERGRAGMKEYPVLTRLSLALIASLSLSLSPRFSPILSS